MKTYKRIDAISDAVKSAYETFFEGQIEVADIATDHGYIAENLIKKDFVKNVVATDISAKSLQKLEKLIDFHHILGINCVLGDGLEPIAKADIAVIAGIGAAEIIKMIETQNVSSDGKNKCNVFVLQPAQNIVELREFLFKNKYYILSDTVVFDEGRFYEIVIVNVGLKQKNKKSIFNLYLGRDNKMDNPDFVYMVSLANEQLKFLDDIPMRRIRRDKVLVSKLKLKKQVNKLLNRR